MSYIHVQAQRLFAGCDLLLRKLFKRAAATLTTTATLTTIATLTTTATTTRTPSTTATAVTKAATTIFATAAEAAKNHFLDYVVDDVFAILT